MRWSYTNFSCCDLVIYRAHLDFEASKRKGIGGWLYIWKRKADYGHPVTCWGFQHLTHLWPLGSLSVTGRWGARIAGDDCLRPGKQMWSTSIWADQTAREKSFRAHILVKRNWQHWMSVSWMWPFAPKGSAGGGKARAGNLCKIMDGILLK